MIVETAAACAALAGTGGMAWWARRRVARAAAEFRASRERLEGRLSVAEGRRYEFEQRAAAAERELAGLRHAMGLDGPRPVAATQVNELGRLAGLSTACLADADGLPTAALGAIDDVDMLAALGGRLTDVLPRGATLCVRDERGTELGARCVEVRGSRFALVAEAGGPISRWALRNTALRLDPSPPPLVSPDRATFTTDLALAPLVRAAAVGAAVRLSTRAGVVEDPHAGAILQRHVPLLEAVHDWFARYGVLRPASIQVSDPNGTAALVLAGEPVLVGTTAESLDVLVEQRLSGLIRRRLTTSDERAA